MNQQEILLKDEEKTIRVLAEDNDDVRVLNQIHELESLFELSTEEGGASN